MCKGLWNFNAYDLAYGLAMGVSAPFWLLMPAARRKVAKAFAQRMGHVAPRTGQGAAVMIHAVSLGEINATGGLVAALRQLRPDLHIIISTTTETGTTRAKELYGKAEEEGKLTLIGYPLDFTAANVRVLDRLRPNLVVLMELEVWPNFLLQCANRGIAVALVNGRMTQPSFQRYRWILPIMRRSLRRMAMVCVQDHPNARRFTALGADPLRVRITGTMKFDTATIGDRIDGDAALADQLGLQPPWIDSAGRKERIWVCGSTGPGEEKLILEQYQLLRRRHAGLRLVLVPRHPPRFDEVAQLITSAGLPLARRSTGKVADPAAVVLGDTMGELRRFYSLADVVFVGRTLVDLGAKQHGSDMIEPAALAKPVIVGPFTGNFADAMGHFQSASAIALATTAAELGSQVDKFLTEPAQAQAMGQRAQEVVRQGKGATQRHVDVIMELLGSSAL